MTAKWSPIWQECKDGCTSRFERDNLLKKARFTLPSKSKKKEGGQYPHKQKAVQ